MASEATQGLFETIKGKTFVALADALGVPRSVLVALRDRLVAPASIPHAFIRRFASAMNSTVEVVQQYLKPSADGVDGGEFQSRSKTGRTKSNHIQGLIGVN
ncbi:MAG: hypothetical protein ACYC5H_14750 [Methylovirgula sp.]